MDTSLWVDKLTKIYGDRQIAEVTAEKMQKELSAMEFRKEKKQSLNQSDSILITYGDTINSPNEKPLATLNKFLKKYIKDVIPTVHILPFFPYSSDDGFSIIDYYHVNPTLGDWNDVKKISNHYSLMVDSVANHVSKESIWFQKFLNGEKPYDEFFIKCDPNANYSSVTRPRCLPLITKFKTQNGDTFVWTTFSDDQIDLNFKNPEVLIEIIKTILTYANYGARFIRLDAIGFIWKELGTTCMHRPQVHEIIKLIRLILSDYIPGVMLITETNVPQKDNISYFGLGNDEASMVYQFPLPPLMMHTLLSGNSTKMTKWYKNLYKPKKGTTYFNFLSSHDGIGLRPASGILSDKEQEFLIKTTIENGGQISYKENSDGTRTPYELNIVYLDALTHPYETDTTRTQKFLTAMSILISLQGVPGIYIHSLLGSRNDYYESSISKIPRRINRGKIDYQDLKKDLESNSLRANVFNGIMLLLKIRKQHDAFSPFSNQKVISINSKVFCFERHSDNETILVISNVSKEKVNISSINTEGFDLISSKETKSTISLEAYQSVWIKKENLI